MKATQTGEHMPEREDTEGVVDLRVAAMCYIIQAQSFMTNLYSHMPHNTSQSA